MGNPSLPAAGVLLRLHDADNVLVATGAIGPGPVPLSGGGSIDLGQRVTLGHKIAARAIAEGERITKYGAPIGSATRAIAEGAHVHVHNMKSDYTATHVLDATAGGEA